MKRVIVSPTGPRAVGPYSQGVVAGDLLFFAGQIPIDPESGELVEGGAADQTRRALENLKALLGAAGLGFDDVVKTTVFMVDLAEFAAMNGVYAEYFSEPYPARSTVQVAALPKGARVEVEAIARGR
jgi:2-iminobutanoate/2-iminopropanoate deaminase